MASTSTSGPSVRAVLLTCMMAVAVGVVGGVVAALLQTPVISTTEPSEDAPEHVPDLGGEPELREVSARELVRDVLGPAIRAKGRGPGRGRIEMAARLSSPDEDVRFPAARELVLRGPDALGLVRRLDPPTELGRKLVRDLTQALDVLRQQRRAKRYEDLWEDKKLELTLAALRRVVPDPYIAATREQYWRERIIGDTRRLELGTIREGELRLAEAMHARARRELEEIDEQTYRDTVDERIDTIRRWMVTEAPQDRRFIGAARAALHRQLELLEENL